ncbi:MAG: TetR/AcrR family transcriptional regulator [Sphingomonadaceae bacterium]|nr:TetR/AcrR family transcriptional regulator [Sphingomonadaceae bacterium]
MDAVERLLVSVGHARMTMRAIAEEADVALGTVSHFGTREQLVEKCIKRLFDWYFEEFTALDLRNADDPKQAFFDLVRYIVDDLESVRTSRLFPEVWAMGNTNAEIQSALDWLFARERDWLEGHLRDGWPALDDAAVRLIIGTLIPMIEGHVMFAPSHRASLYEEIKPADAIIFWLNATLERLESV